MKKLLILVLIIAGCSHGKLETRKTIMLSGKWGFRIDTADAGITARWFDSVFTDSVSLPGSMAENNRGFEVTVNTDWTGEIVDRSYFTDSRYAKYREPGNIKIPFWLKPVKYYKGAAWYTKDVDLPSESDGNRVILFMERCHWQSDVYVNGNHAGTQNSLSTPHEYDITGFIKKGKNHIAVRIDNRIIIPIGINSHSISDHTQTDWNGIAGEISLKTTPVVYIKGIDAYPSLKDSTALIEVNLSNDDLRKFKGTVELRAYDSQGRKPAGTKVFRYWVDNIGYNDKIRLIYNMGDKPETWNEFSNSLYSMEVTLKDSANRIYDRRSVNFGMREFRAHGSRFEINGLPVFLRGTTECCIFPLTGYPPCDTASWGRIFRICRQYGLNHMRFHSYCPPEAAFIAADKYGIYLHVECSSWANSGTTIGDSTPVDRFIYDESERIIRAYGNHPSFCMLAYGNEPAGKNQDKFLGDLIKHWRLYDNRRVYTSGAGWPIIPENDYHLTAEPRIQHWGEGLGSVINSKPPATNYDFRDFVSKYKIPVVSHEIGQWCVYPDFGEIAQYTGVLKPTNFEIFRETLEKNHMGNQAAEFVSSSGKLQVLCYKADIEAALRTPGFAGFQMLQLHDFPGQGTALVGILNPFFGSKGYVTPEAFRQFCNTTVPLARMEKMTLSDSENFHASLEVAHFGAGVLKNTEFICRLENEEGEIITEKKIVKDSIGVGNCQDLGVFDARLKGSDGKLTFSIEIPGTGFKNSWNIWVYPAAKPVEGDVLVTDKLDSRTIKVLGDGGKVLLLINGKIRKEKGASILNGYSTIFWNTAWTNNQPPHTMGIVCDKWHPVFKEFPTDANSDANWWDATTKSQVMDLDGFPAGLKPLVQMIDTWFENKRLALAFEASAGKGKILVSSIDFKKDIDERISTKQLYVSILNYMNSNAFNPVVSVDVQKIKSLFE
ncbi:MAG: glycoside hydrolase family 2 TIM barrel-domain containing protein [Bacteroidales bacterium]